jgi:hypothetical protein
MRTVKCIKFEVEIVCESELETDEAIKWIENAMDVYCEFEGWQVKVVEEHRVLAHEEGVATA